MAVPQPPVVGGGFSLEQIKSYKNDTLPPNFALRHYCPRSAQDIRVKVAPHQIFKDPEVRVDSPGCDATFECSPQSSQHSFARALRNRPFLQFCILNININVIATFFSRPQASNNRRSRLVHAKMSPLFVLITLSCNCWRMPAPQFMEDDLHWGVGSS